jgi:hypothetical protein
MLSLFSIRISNLTLSSKPRFHQAYTQVIEETVKDSFDALGLRFIANNYAMDGMNSGPELALCLESVFGFEVDILNW